MEWDILFKFSSMIKICHPKRAIELFLKDLLVNSKISDATKAQALLILTLKFKIDIRQENFSNLEHKSSFEE